VSLATSLLRPSKPLNSKLGLGVGVIELCELFSPTPKPTPKPTPITTNAAA